MEKIVRTNNFMTPAEETVKLVRRPPSRIGYTNMNSPDMARKKARLEAELI